MTADVHPLVGVAVKYAHSCTIASGECLWAEGIHASVANEAGSL